MKEMGEKASLNSICIPGSVCSVIHFFNVEVYALVKSSWEICKAKESLGREKGSALTRAKD